MSVHGHSSEYVNIVLSLMPFNLAVSMSSIDHKKQNGCLETLMANTLL